MSEIEQLVQLFRSLQQDTVLSYNTVSATITVLYEVALTFPEELQYIWLSRWSPVTILHLLIRYFALAYLIVCSIMTIDTNLSTTFCNPMELFQIWGVTALVPAVDILIVIRVFALYNQNRWIGGILAFCWLSETAIIFTLTGLGFGSHSGASPNPLRGIFPGCVFADPFNSHNLIIGGSVAIGFQAVYLGLALYKLAHQFKSVRLLTPLLETFYRDGALYCFNILAMYGLSVFFAQNNAPDTPLQGLGGIWLVAIVSITAGRLVLNLKNSVHKPSTHTFISYQSTEFHFTTPTNTQQMRSTIILDTSRIVGNINENVMEIEPLPSSYNVTLVQQAFN